MEARAGQPTLLMVWAPLAPWLILGATAVGQFLLGSIRVQDPAVGSIRARLLWATAAVWRWYRGGTRGWGGNVAHPSHQTGCFPGRRVSCGKILGDKFVRRCAAWRHTPEEARPACAKSTQSSTAARLRGRGGKGFQESAKWRNIIMGLQGA